MIKCPRCGYSEEEVKSPPVSSQPPTQSIVGEYAGIKKAVPQISQKRERFVKRELTLEDVVAPRTRLNKLPSMDSELRQYSYQGENLFFGQGIEEEL